MKTIIFLFIGFLLMSDVPDLLASGKKAKIFREQIIGTWYVTRYPDVIHHFYEDGSTFDEGPNVRNSRPLCWVFKKPNIILIKHVIDSDSYSCSGDFEVKITIVRMMEDSMLVNIYLPVTFYIKSNPPPEPVFLKNVKFVRKK